MTPTFIKSFPAAAAIEGNRLIMLDADGAALHAAANTAGIVGISERLGAKAGGMADVVQGGWYEVKLGGPVSPGDPITADATGAGIAAVPAAGMLVRYAGFAMTGGVAGDLAPVFIAPGIINA